jgi:aquaporin Z
MAGHSAIPPPGSHRDTAHYTAAAFADSRLEWRLLAEFAGTFFLVLAASGADVVNVVSHGEVGRTAAVTAPGLMVLALVLHDRRDVRRAPQPGRHGGVRRPRQLPVGPGSRLRARPGVRRRRGGGAAAVDVRHGRAARRDLPQHDVTVGAVRVTEIVLTFGLVTLILGTASGARNVGHNAAIAVGGYVVLAGLWASPLSGAPMNPARSLGPALIGGDFGDVWIYLLGPVTGAARGRGGLGAARTSLIRRRPGSPGDRAGWQGNRGRRLFPCPREGYVRRDRGSG